MPDIDEATLIELGKLALKVGHDPKTRRDFFKAVQKVAPERYASQADQVMQDKLDELTEKIERDKIERKQDEIRIQTEAARKALAARYSEDDIKKIETDVMEKHRIDDYEVAAKLYAADLALATPKNDTPRPSATWEMPSFDGLMKNPIGAARDMAFKVIDELNRGKR